MPGGCITACHVMIDQRNLKKSLGVLHDRTILSLRVLQNQRTQKRLNILQVQIGKEILHHGFHLSNKFEGEQAERTSCVPKARPSTSEHKDSMCISFRFQNFSRKKSSVRDLSCEPLRAQASGSSRPGPGSPSPSSSRGASWLFGKVLTSVGLDP